MKTKSILMNNASRGALIAHNINLIENMKRDRQKQLKSMKVGDILETDQGKRIVTYTGSDRFSSIPIDNE